MGVPRLRRRRTTRARPGGVSGCSAHTPHWRDLEKVFLAVGFVFARRKAPIDLTSSQEYPVRLVIPTYQ